MGNIRSEREHLKVIESAMDVLVNELELAFLQPGPFRPEINNPANWLQQKELWDSFMKKLCYKLETLKNNIRDIQYTTGHRRG